MSQEFAAAKLELGQANALVKILGGMGVVMRLLQGTSKAVIELVKFLTKLVTFPVPDVKEFVLNEAKLKEANIGFAWDEFKRRFLNKKCPSARSASYASHRIEKDSVDKPLLAELADKAETTMAHFIWLITQQSKGQEGVLLTNGYANIFYMKDDEDVLWAVRCIWDSGYGYWDVHAYSVEDPRKWFAGNQVISCD